MQTMTQTRTRLGGTFVDRGRPRRCGRSRRRRVRVRGEITKVDGNTLSVKSRTGENLTVKLAEPMRVSAMVKSSLADIKEGTFIGVSAMPQPDGTPEGVSASTSSWSRRRASSPTGFRNGTAGPAAP